MTTEASTEKDLHNKNCDKEFKKATKTGFSDNINPVPSEHVSMEESISENVSPGKVSGESPGQESYQEGKRFSLLRSKRRLSSRSELSKESTKYCSPQEKGKA